MAFADFVVVLVVSGRDLHATRSKLHIHVFVGDDFDFAV